jgi:hypothetical protein
MRDSCTPVPAANRLPRDSAPIGRHDGNDVAVVAGRRWWRPRMESERDSQVVGPSGKLVERVRGHVDAANELLEQSHTVAQQAAVRVAQTHRRVQRVYRQVQYPTAAVPDTHQAAPRHVDRFIEVKQRELRAHRKALKVHERAAELQEQLGHPDRAAEARVHAEHAQELYRVACEELAQYQERVAAAKDKAAKTARRSS